MNFPVVDLHCDLLSYLAQYPDGSPNDTDEIGCAIPFLQKGNVCVQIMAVYTPTGPESTKLYDLQMTAYHKLLKHYHKYFYQPEPHTLDDVAARGDRTATFLAIENGSGLCLEDEPLDKGLQRLDQLIRDYRHILYISLTHHDENRFGGGNKATAGLKPDGKHLLEFLSGKKIAVDLSHTSDALAYDIVNYIHHKGLDIPFIASHSNFRSVCAHNRNLPDDLVSAIAAQNGLIGMNLLRPYIHPDDPAVLKTHIRYGFEQGAGHCMAMGADFFATREYGNTHGVPFFYEEHQDASCYPGILNSVSDTLGVAELKALAYENAVRFMQQLWSVEENA
jgi:microsomal dipeptidase-like Zn-dependent dipeptidase